MCVHHVEFAVQRKEEGCFVVCQVNGGRGICCAGKKHTYRVHSSVEYCQSFCTVSL